MRLAAGDGWSIALVGLAKMHRHGHGVPRDERQAQILTERAKLIEGTTPYENSAQCDPKYGTCVSNGGDVPPASFARYWQNLPCGPD